MRGGHHKAGHCPQPQALSSGHARGAGSPSCAQQRRLSLGTAGEEEEEDGWGPLAAGLPARRAQTLTAGSKTVTPDLFSLQLNLNPD